MIGWRESRARCSSRSRSDPPRRAYAGVSWATDDFNTAGPGVGLAGECGQNFFAAVRELLDDLVAPLKGDGDSILLMLPNGIPRGLGQFPAHGEVVNACL